MIRGMQRGRAESSADAGLIEWRRASRSSTSQSASRAAKEVAGADAAQGKARRLRRQCRRPRRGRQAKADGVAVASAPAQPGPSNGSVCWKCHIASVAIARMRPTPETIREADGSRSGIRNGSRRAKAAMAKAAIARAAIARAVVALALAIKGTDKPMHQSILSMVPMCTRNMHQGI